MALRSLRGDTGFQTSTTQFPAEQPSPDAGQQSEHAANLESLKKSPAAEFGELMERITLPAPKYSPSRFTAPDGKSLYHGCKTMEKPTFEELQMRLKRIRSREDFDDRLACCWQGYLAALLEWDLISPNEHKSLVDIIPTEHPAPTDTIFLG